ncbi:MAG TPA: GAF and ANTAR domain-containing protein [Cellulomonas sp.]
MSEPPAGVDGPGASLSPEQAQSDALDLRSSLSDLAGMVTGSIPMDELLSRVATYASRAIPGADGAGVTLLRAKGGGNRVEAMAASAPFVAEIDEIQYAELNEGPCISAALERRTVRSGSLGGDKQWPRFGPRVGRLGVHSVLSLPLLVPDRVVGAINVYAHAKDVFDDHATELGELFATPAAVAVHNAQVLAQAMALATQLQTALSSRPVIDQAVGIIRARSGSTAEEAFARLRTISQHENVRLATVAARVVDEAVRRARAHNPTA